MSYTDQIRDFIRSQAASEAGQQAGEGYTGSSHIHHGLSVPVMRRFVQEWTKNNVFTFESFVTTLDDQYSGTSLEERMIGGMLLARLSKFRRLLPLEKLETWLGSLEGWAEVDGTCYGVFSASEILAKWNEWQGFLRKLAHDANINKRRASLVLLTRAVRESADPRLFALALEQIETLKGEKDKRITKAVSWLLREGIRHHRTALQSYLDANQGALPKATLREVTNKLNTGKKS